MKKVLDEKTLSVNHPDLFEKYLRQSDSTKAIINQPMVGY